MDQHLSQRRHHVGRVMKRKSTDDPDGKNPVGKRGVVESNEYCSDVIRLGKMAIELLRQLFQDNLPYAVVWFMNKTRIIPSGPALLIEHKSRSIDKLLPGSAIPTVNNFSSTSLMISIECALVWKQIGSLENSRQHVMAAADRTSKLSSSK